MSRASLVFAALLLVPTLGTSSTEQAPANPAVTAQQFVKSYVKAMNRADVASMMKMFSKRSGVTAIGDGSISHGWKSIQMDAQQFVGREGTFKFTVGLVDVTPLGSGYVLAVAPLTVQTVGQEEDVEVPAAMTLVLEQADKSWKVLHEHWSSRDAEDIEGVVPDGEGDGGIENFDAPAPRDHDTRLDLTIRAPRVEEAACTHGMTCRGGTTFASTSTP
ncbi:MAG TPA: nuclear transport factor 2 family protein [Candidatus Eisenbacteria bacterium]